MCADNDLAGFHLAHEVRAYDVERHRLGGENGRAREVAQYQRANAEWIARANELLVGERHQCVGPLYLRQCFHEAAHHARLTAPGDELQDRFRVGGRLEDRAVPHKLVPERDGVGKIAIMGDREAAAPEIGKKRLHVAQDGPARCRIAHMADRHAAAQPVDHLGR